MNDLITLERANIQLGRKWSQLESQMTQKNWDRVTWFHEQEKVLAGLQYTGHNMYPDNQPQKVLQGKVDNFSRKKTSEGFDFRSSLDKAEDREYNYNLLVKKLGQKIIMERATQGQVIEPPTDIDKKRAE